MNIGERLSIALRHSRHLENASWLWDGVRPVYNKIVDVLGNRGLVRVINGTDEILIAPSVRGLPEQYEPDVWRHVMSEVKPGDIVADVGAYVGLYTVALAKRVGASGRVVAFEPNPWNAEVLKQHIHLNRLDAIVDLKNAAVGEVNGVVDFVSDLDVSHIAVSGASTDGGKEKTPQTLTRVKAVTLDSIFKETRLDLLKIDVEGYEEHVLRGAHELLSDKHRAPRCIYIEVHPYAWPDLNVSSDSLLALLARYDYRVFSLTDEIISEIRDYGEVVARRDA